MNPQKLGRYPLCVKSLLDDWVLVLEADQNEGYFGLRIDRPVDFFNVSFASVSSVFFYQLVRNLNKCWLLTDLDSHRFLSLREVIKHGFGVGVV